MPAFWGFRMHLSYLSFGIQVYPNVQACVFHMRWSLFVIFHAYQHSINCLYVN